MPFLDVMHAYVRGERIESLYLIVPIGVAMVAFAAVTLRAERGGFAWGLAVPLEAGLASDPGAMVAEELPRMRKVNDNWPVYVGM